MSKQTVTFFLSIGTSFLLAACSAGSTVDSVTLLPPTAVTDISSMPQATAGTQTSLSFDCHNIQEIPAEECRALVALYESADGDHWQDNPGWLVDEMPCTWHGVICQQGHVAELELYYNQLTGSLPHEIGNLTYLKSLYLDNNQLSGPLPQEIGSLTKLQVARLGGNQFSSIPAEIANLDSLVYLELWGNQLGGKIPDEISNLSNLQELNLNFNQFTGSIPPELGNLAYLHQLDLSHNLLSGSIPATLGDLRSLNQLDLSFNRLTGSIPPELEDLSNLYWLDLSYNELTGVVPVGMAQAPISERRLWGNLFDGTVLALQGMITTVEYQGAKFDFNSALAKSVWPEIVAAQEPSVGGPGWEVSPEHVRFTFAYPREPNDFQVDGAGILGPPQILIYPTQAYSSMSELAKEEIEAAQSLLETRPPAPENEMPFLPLINAAQVFHSQVKYLDFQNGSGVRFITHYSQEVVGRLTNENIFYTFQGLTQDGAYYVAVYFPISADGLGNELVQEDWEAAQAHLAEDIRHLDSLSSDKFEPELEILDGVVQSLLVETP
jgi:hypothetical protein